jgi:hypothetical protein
MPEINQPPNQSPTPNQSPKKSNWFESHPSSYYWLAILIAAVICWVMLYRQINNWILSLSEPGIQVRLMKPSAQLSLSPQTKSVNTGDSLVVDIILDTANKPIDGVDIYALHYDPTILKVNDDLPGQKGIQILPGKLMGANGPNLADEKSGRIIFGQVASGGTHFSGRGVLATIHFTALAPGTAYLKFDFKPGGTKESNVAWHGKEQLARVVDGIYTVQAK